MLLLLQLNNLLGDAPTLVPVPDVVGQTQASGTTELEGDLFVVAVTTAYSSVVAAGLIISQSPTAGSDALEGSTVTITVSLGDAPVSEGGGGGFYFDFDYHISARRKRKRELEEAEEAAQELQDKVEAEIAKLLHEQQKKDEERANLERIKKLVSRYPSEKVDSERVDRALKLAQQKQTLASYEALQREYERMLDEEDALFIAILAMID